MGDYISTSEQPTTPAPLDEGEPSPDQTKGEPNILGKYAVLKDEIESLQQENADLKSSLYDKTLQFIKSRNELRRTVKSLKDASDVELMLKNKIKELTAERDEARQGCFLGMTANAIGAINSTPANDEKNISSDHQPLLENLPVASAIHVLENQKETKKDVPHQEDQKEDQSLSEKSEDLEFLEQCKMKDSEPIVESPSGVPPPIPEHKVVDQMNFFHGKNKTTELEDDERDNYHTVMNSLEEEIKSLLKINTKLKSIHGGELKKIREQLRWSREDYYKLEANCNAAIVAWKQGHDFVSQKLYEANNDTQKYKDLLAKCSNECWETMKKLNDALERELRLRKELDAVNEVKDKDRLDNIVSMVTPQDLNKHEAKTEQNDVPAAPVPMDEIINAAIPPKSLEENVLMNNNELLVPTNSSSTTEAENLNKSITHQDINGQEQEQGNETREKEKPLDLFDWEMIDLIGNNGMSDNNIQKESSVVVPPIQEDKVEEKQIENNELEDKTERSLEQGTKNSGVSAKCDQGAFDRDIMQKLIQTELQKLFPIHLNLTNIQRTEFARAFYLAEKFIKIREQQISSKDEHKMRIEQSKYSGSAEITGQQLSEKEKTDKNGQQDDKNNKEFQTPIKFDFKSDEDIAVVEACLEYVFSTDDKDKELKTKVANIFMRPFDIGLGRLRELQDYCDNAVLGRLTTENILKSCNYGEKTQSDKILDACVVFIKKEKNQIWRNQQHDFIKAYPELPTLMSKLAKK